LDFGLLLIILFIVAPLLERLLKAGQQPPEPPPQGGLPGQRRPGQPLPGQQPRRIPPMADEEEISFRDVPAGHGREEESAEGMLPDDLWEILTGEKRPQRPPPPEPQPAESAPAEVPRAQVPPPVRTPSEVARRAEALRQRVERERARREELERRRTRQPEPSRERSLPSVEMRDRSPRERERRPAAPPPSAADRHVRPVHVRTAPVVVSYDIDIPGDDERHAQFHERLDRDAAAARKAAAVVGPRVFDFDDPTDLRRAIIMAEVLGKPKGLE
jgi:hypothetical protein